MTGERREERCGRNVGSGAVGRGAVQSLLRLAALSLLLSSSARAQDDDPRELAALLQSEAPGRGQSRRVQAIGPDGHWRIDRGPGPAAGRSAARIVGPDWAWKRFPGRRRRQCCAMRCSPPAVASCWESSILSAPAAIRRPSPDSRSCSPARMRTWWKRPRRRWAESAMRLRQRNWSRCSPRMRPRCAARRPKGACAAPSTCGKRGRSMRQSSCMTACVRQTSRGSAGWRRREGPSSARGAAGAPLVVEQLQAADKREFALGLTLLRELEAGDLIAQAADLWGELPPQRRGLLLIAAADRTRRLQSARANAEGEAAAVRALVRQGAADRSPAVVRAAVEAMRTLNDSAFLPELLEFAESQEAALQEAALAALEGLPDPQIDAQIAARLDEARGPARGAAEGGGVANSCGPRPAARGGA